MRRSREALRAGSVWVTATRHDPAVPFGRIPDERLCRSPVSQHVEESLNVKAVWVKTA